MLSKKYQQISKLRSECASNSVSCLLLYDPAPWTVRAWYDARRGWHVIDIAAHPQLSTATPLGARVYRGGVHRANRWEFRCAGTQLYPDDKFENRIIHRSKGDAIFLIDITVGDLQLDFYHESATALSATSVIEMEDASVIAATPAVHPLEQRFAVASELAKAEEIYRRETEKVEQYSTLSEDRKIQMKAHLLRIYNDYVRELAGDDGHA
jgi:hypothetical protein